MKRELAVGVIGHVDHGKTALVEALTGTSTDRLKEERERGMSIVLGFAHLTTDTAVIDLIDVPGHEAFVRAMIAGATGFDGVVLVVAANEGVKPQTREHLAIARLLDIRRGIVVLTKTDLVAPEQTATVAAELRALTAGTFLDGAPLLIASIKEAASIAAVRAALETLASTPMTRPSGRAFFLPVDRVFTLRGFGVVATGTLRGGTLATGDSVTVMPRELTATVRGLQRHNREVAEALPGQRVAVNLRGIERSELARGDVLAAPGALRPTRCVDADLQLLKDAPDALANGRRVRILTGATEALARVRLLDTETLAQGATGFVQLRTEKPLATRAGERYLLRAYSPMRTLGGGRILDTQPRRHRRFDSAVLEQLRGRAAGDLKRVLGDALAAAGIKGIACRATAASLGLCDSELRSQLDALAAVPAGDDRVIAEAVWTTLLAQILAGIDEFHARHPRELGIAAEALRRQCTPVPDPALLRLALGALARDRKIETVGDALRRTGFTAELEFNVEEQRIVDVIEKAFRTAGLEPPSPETVLGRDARAKTLYKLLLERGRLVRLSTYARGTEIVLHADTLTRVQRELAGRYPHPRRFTIAEARDLLGTTRKHVTPLMEHLDATGFTIRIGDVRQLRAP
ncbi:MAG TPA: selenocysteine-specific translation elongation factor [Gammaproteobacteria bacterium]|jgi:selenocysteine-specific elongation factor